MHGDRGQNARVVVGVSIDVVVAVAINRGTAVRGHSSTIPRDHRMRNPNYTLERVKSSTIVYDNDIAQQGRRPRTPRRRRSCWKTR
jgi:hypothetical protein